MAKPDETIEEINVTPGVGKYDDACAAARKMTGGSVLLIVIDGKHGSGFSVSVLGDVINQVPGVLRYMADDIDRQMTPQTRPQ